MVAGGDQDTPWWPVMCVKLETLGTGGYVRSNCWNVWLFLYHKERFIYLRAPPRPPSLLAIFPMWESIHARLW